MTQNTGKTSRSTLLLICHCALWVWLSQCWSLSCVPTPPVETHRTEGTLQESGRERSLTEGCDAGCPEQTADASAELAADEPTPDKAPLVDTGRETTPEPHPKEPEPSGESPREVLRDSRDAGEATQDDSENTPEPRQVDQVPEQTPPKPRFPFATIEYTKTQLIVQPIEIDGNERLNYGLSHFMALGSYTYEGKAITTVDKEHFYIVHFGSKTGPYNIERRQLFGFQKSRSYSLKSRRPTALYPKGPWLYVGGIEGKQTRVDTIDFRLSIPLYNARFTAKQSFRQEIDDFALTGNKLIAIDDVVIPKYAYVFSLAQDGGYGKHEFTSYLPIAIGGTYPEGVADGDWLYLRGTFDNGHGLGGGQILLRISIGKQELKEQARLTEYDTGTDPKVELLYGQTFTTFQGLEVLGDVLLVGAGERGVFALPKLFTSKDKATHVDVGGSCTDIVKIAGEVFALVQQANQTRLSWLVWDQSTRQVRIKRSYTLKGRPTRFPR